MDWKELDDSCADLGCDWSIYPPKPIYSEFHSNTSALNGLERLCRQERPCTTNTAVDNRVSSSSPDLKPGSSTDKYVSVVSSYIALTLTLSYI